ncbi:DUF1367 family protein [Candidatus Babeliales bacterium]|nr:DUF1367 family protein [Candidatus Babeliales bacterium]
MELRFAKPGPGTILAPADEQTAEAIKRLKIGEIIHGDYKKQRNYRFHKKMFALLNFAFDHWQPGKLQDPKWKGIKPEPNFDRFRKDLIILAGFYEAHYRVNGEVRIEAKSIKFGKMDETEFSELYNKVINVVLQKILVNYSRDELDNVIDNLLSFT